MVMIAKKSILNQDDVDQFSSLIKKGFLLFPHQIVELQRGEVIYHQGDKINKVGFILEGVMKCANYTDAGNEINAHYFYEGEIFPEYLLLAGESQYIYTLIAEKRSKIILIDSVFFKKTILSDMKWCQLMIVYMAKRGMLAEKWKLCNGYGDLRRSIAYMLLEIYGVSGEYWVEIKDTQRIISTKLQVSRTAYNQEMIKLEEENIIKRNRSNIKLLNCKKLESYI